MTFKGKFILWGCNNTKRFYTVDMILRVCINVYMYGVLNLLRVFAVISITIEQ